MRLQSDIFLTPSPFFLVSGAKQRFFPEWMQPFLLSARRRNEEGATALGQTTFSITTLSILIIKMSQQAHNIQPNDSGQIFIVMLSVVMLSVVMLSVVMLSVVMLSVIMLSVIMLSVIMLSVVILSVVMLSVVILNVVAPPGGRFRI
jgi:hypothetical protein